MGEAEERRVKAMLLNSIVEGACRLVKAGPDKFEVASLRELDDRVWETVEEAEVADAVALGGER